MKTKRNFMHLWYILFSIAFACIISYTFGSTMDRLVGPLQLPGGYFIMGLLILTMGTVVSFIFGKLLNISSSKKAIFCSWIGLGVLVILSGAFPSPYVEVLRHFLAGAFPWFVYQALFGSD